MTTPRSATADKTRHRAHSPRTGTWVLSPARCLADHRSAAAVHVVSPQPIDPAWVLRHFERQDQFPVLAALTESERQARRRYGTEPDSFQFGLRRILDGLATHTAAAE